MVVLLLLYIMTVCSGCNKAYLYVYENNVNVNYNNISAKNSSFWLTADTGYYTSAPCYTINYFAVSGNHNQKLYSAHNAAFARIQAYDNMVYTLDWVDDTVYRLCSYNTDTKEHSVLAYPTNVQSYFVVGQYVYYTQECEANTGSVQLFCAYSLADGTKKKIATSVLDAGVINSTPVYIIQENNDFQLYAYNPINGKSELMGSFSCPMTSDEYVEDFVNFTSDQVILTISKDAESRVLCYDIGSGQVSENNVAGWVWSLIAYDDYAFMIIIDDINEETQNWKSAMYRVQLHNGQMERITQLEGVVDTFVTSDQCVYVVQSTESDAIYRYDYTGEKALVGKW